MAIIDPNGLFNGDRLRRCSNLAQLHWPRLFYASDGFGRIEINYARIIGRAYATFNPVPSEADLQSWIEEYAKNFLLFLYQGDGQVWGQWDTKKEFLPRYKTASDKRSPIPPEDQFIEWKRLYREQYKALPKSFGNFPEEFLHGGGVGGGVGKNICASGDARVSIDKPLLLIEEASQLRLSPRTQSGPNGGMSAEQETWFPQWWDIFWLHKAKKQARDAFQKHVKTPERFQQVMAATRAQSAEMQTREPSKRPYGSSWLNGERWEDEVESRPATAAPNDDYPELS